jgi:hypothetical protein
MLTFLRRPSESGPIFVVAGQKFPEQGQTHEQPGHDEVYYTFGKGDVLMLV